MKTRQTPSSPSSIRWRLRSGWSSAVAWARGDDGPRSSFGSTAAVSLDRRAVVGWVALLLAVFLILALRSTHSVFRPQLWAEDGTFLGDQLLGVTGIFSPHSGYPHLLQRSVAAFADLFPVRRAPKIYNGAAFAIATVSLSWLALPRFRHLLAADGWRAGLCLLFAAMPILSIDALGNLANVQPYLLVWCALVVLQPTRTRGGAYALVVGFAIALFSAPLVLTLAPLWILRGVYVPADRVRCAVVVGICLVYAGVLTVTAEVGHAPALGYALSAAPRVLAVRVAGMGLLGRDLIVTAPMVQTADSANLVAAAVAFVLGALAWRARRRAALSLVVLYLAVAPVLVVLTFREQANHGGAWSGGGARYFVLATAMFYLWLLAQFEQLRAAPWARVSAVVVLVLVVLGIRDNFFDARERVDYDWRQHAATLEAAREERRGYIVVPINPTGWTIDLRYPSE